PVTSRVWCWVISPSHGVRPPATQAFGGAVDLIEQARRAGGQRLEARGRVLPYADEELLQEEEREGAASGLGRAPVDARPAVHRLAETIASAGGFVHARGEPGRKARREAMGQEIEPRLAPPRVLPVDQPDRVPSHQHVAGLEVAVRLGGRQARRAREPLDDAPKRADRVAEAPAPSAEERCRRDR